MGPRPVLRGAAFAAFILAVALLLGAAPKVFAESPADKSAVSTEAQLRAKVARITGTRVTQKQRETAAARMRIMRGLVSATPESSMRSVASASAPGPGGIPDYFGSTPNWAYSPPLRKFVDGLPGLGAGKANNLGQYIPVANPDTMTYPGSDYYEIELRQYTEKLHSDLPATTLRGYVQVNKGTDAAGHNTIEPDSDPLPRPVHRRAQGPPGAHQVHQQAAHR